MNNYYAAALSGAVTSDTRGWAGAGEPTTHLETDPAALAAIRAQSRANVLATRRRVAAEALLALPGGDYHARQVEHPALRGLMNAKSFLRGLADTEQHGPAARVALDALGKLWCCL